MADPAQVASLLAPRETRSVNPFQDDVVSYLLGSLNDSLHAAWNGWESACTMQDEEKQDYYMKIVVHCNDLAKKLRKL